MREKIQETEAVTLLLPKGSWNLCPISEHNLNAGMLMCVSMRACVFIQTGFKRQQLYRAQSYTIMIFTSVHPVCLSFH